MKNFGPLALEGVTKHFQGSGGVSGLSFSVKQGEGFSLLGPSGCGKSTTLRIIGGFEIPDQGRVYHGENDITLLPPQKRDIRTVFQKYALFPHLNVEENIAFGLRMQKASSKVISEKLAWALSLLEISSLKGRQIQQLSGGEQQRVALARALVTNPSILLLDEPLSALDLKLRERMQMELLSLRHKLGSTFVFVTHDQNEAMTLSDRIAVMQEGAVLQIGTPQEIYLKPLSRFVAEFIGQANFFSFERRDQILGDRSRLPDLTDKHAWMVRPEHFTARKPGWNAPPGYLFVSVNIAETAFLGPERVTKCTDRAGMPLFLKSPGFEPAPGQPGEEILLTWEAEDTWTVASS